MDYAMNVAMDGFGILILILMLFNFGAKLSRKHETDDAIFSAMLLCNIAVLAADILTWVSNGLPGTGARAVGIFSNSVYYSLQTVMCFFWVLYCDYKLNGSIPLLKKRLTIYSMPLIASFLLVLFNYYEPILFYIDENNFYVRGNLYIVFLAICFLSFAYTFFITLRAIARDPIAGRQRIFLLLYPILPVTCAVLQSMFYGIAIIWTGTVVSLLILYFNLQNAQITTDPLTGLNNRYRFENYMHSRLDNRQSDEILFLLMIDIDKFKEINDRHGHATGDNAIREAAQLLSRGIHRHDFVARIGGDEFVVVGERRSRQEVADTIASIRREASSFLKETSRPYAIDFSIGYSLLHDNFPKTMDEMLAEADQRMYNEKQLHHSGLEL